MSLPEMRSLRGLRLAAGLGVVALLITACSGGTPASMRSDSSHPTAPLVAASERGGQQVLESYANLPLGFVANQGQTDRRVRYYAEGSRYAFYLTPKEIVLSFVKGTDAPRGVALGLRFVGGNRQVVLEGEGRVPGEVNYFRGNDPAQWRTELPQNSQVVYRELWPGIDLVLRGLAGKLKYEFRVRPGARLADIRLAYSGAAGLELDDSGGLLIKTALGVLRDSPPEAYQEVAGERVPVDSRYALDKGAGATRGYGFAVGPNYDPGSELIIDPGLDYSTFLGGANHDFGSGIAVDSAGNAYVVGTTHSGDFPTTPGAFDTRLASAPDVFVTKLNSSGSALVYSSYLGGTPTPVPAGGADPFEFGRGIAIDSAGNAYVTGQTTSGDFPTTSGAFDRTLNVGTFDATDAFVTKLNATGSALLYSTFLGGTDLDDGLGIGIDSTGNAYVTGQTASRNLPTTSGAFDTTANGGFDAFATKLNTTGSALVYSSYLGGTDNEMGSRVAIDGAGNAHVGGSTRSAGFPTTSGAFDTTANGGFDAFATKLNTTGSALVYSTFVGGGDVDFGDGLAIDAAGNTYVSGGTISLDFPTTTGALDRTLNGGSDAFVTKVNPAGSALAYSTLLGGNDGEGSTDIFVDAANNAWVTGGTSSPDFPTTLGSFDAQFSGGGADAFVTELNATGSALAYSTFLGGTDSENGRDLALDSAGGVYVTGHTYSADFPTTSGAFDRVFAGNPGIFWGDAFVSKLRFGDAPPPPPPSAPSLISPANDATAVQPITFDWTDVADAASYTVQIDDSSGFTTPLVRQQSTTQSRLTTSGLSSARHWWRVRGVNSAGVAGAWSEVRSVRPRLAAPSLISPANGAQFSPGQSITFDWGDVAGAAGYTIQIDDTQTFSAPMTVNRIVGASRFTTSTLPTARMWWRVRARDAAGSPGPWSAVRRVEVRS